MILTIYYLCSSSCGCDVRETWEVGRKATREVVHVKPNFSPMPRRYPMT